MWEMSHKKLQLQRTHSQARELMARSPNTVGVLRVFRHNTASLRSCLSYFPSDRLCFITVTDKSHQCVSLRFCVVTFSPSFTHSEVMYLNA